MKKSIDILLIPKQPEESRICQGGALNFDQRSSAEAAKLKKFSDAGGSKYSGCPTQAETDSSGCFGITRFAWKN